MRVAKKSAEAVVAKKAWKQTGAKGRRTKRQAILNISVKSASRILKWVDVATAAAIHASDREGLVDSNLNHVSGSQVVKRAKEE